MSKTPRSASMTPSRRGALLVVGLVAVALSGCVRTGYLRLGKPRVHDTEATRATMKAGGPRIATEVRKADVTAIQELMTARELTSVSGRVAAAAAPSAGGPAPTPEPPTAAPAPSTATMPALPEHEFGRTISEQAHDLRHREARAVEVELLYSGAGNDEFLGRNARIYLVSFEIGVFPTRQSKWLYPINFFGSLFGDNYDFTQDWFTNIDFVVPPATEGSKAQAVVYEVFPRYDVLTAREAAAAAQQLQLTAAAAGEGLAGQLDYLRRLEEQFAQQRRYPLQLGMIESPYRWSWAFGTRRQLHERSPWVSWIPFVGKYETRAFVEPGMRTGHVVLLIEDITAYAYEQPKEAQGKQEAQNEQEAQKEVCYRSPSFEAEDLNLLEFKLREYRGLDAGDVSEAIRKQIPKTREPRRCDKKIRLPVVAIASYLKLEQPSRRIPLPISSPDGGKREALLLELELDPANPEKRPKVAFVNATSKWHDGLALVAVNVPGRKLTEEGVRKVVVRDESRKRPLRVASFETFDDEIVHAIVSVPDEPGASVTGCSTPTGKCIELSGRVVTKTHDYLWDPAKPHPFTGPWSKAPSSRITMSPGAGGAGRKVTFAIGEGLRTATTRPTNATHVARVMFGSTPVGPGTNGWQAAAGHESFYFMAPPPPKGAKVVDVVVHFKNGRAPMTVGSYQY